MVIPIKYGLEIFDVLILAKFIGKFYIVVNGKIKYPNYLSKGSLSTKPE